MAEIDIAPKLLEAIRRGFTSAFNADAEITRLYKKVADGSVSFVDASAFAVRTGELLSAQLKKHITADALPDGKLYFNIAKKVISPVLNDDYELVNGVCESIQENIYASLSLGIKPIPAGVNVSRVNGLAWKAAQYDEFKDAAWLLDEPIINFSQNVVDEFIQVNTQFQYDSGLAPKIIRTVVGDCCEWCGKVAGTYDYNEVRETGNDVFRRHERCRCTVDYVLGRRKQNVHSKKWSDATPRQIEIRKTTNKS